MGEANLTLVFEQEGPEHGAQIDNLLHLAFGPGRFAKTAERLREGNTPIAELCLIAFENDAMRASVRYWPIMIGQTPALLLGPLAVDPTYRGKGIGIRLMEKTLAKAKELGHERVVLVGDEPYYARVGFQKVPPGLMSLPGPVDPARLLVAPLVDNALDRVSGPITRRR